MRDFTQKKIIGWLHQQSITGATRVTEDSQKFSKEEDDTPLAALPYENAIYGTSYASEGSHWYTQSHAEAHGVVCSHTGPHGNTRMNTQTHRSSRRLTNTFYKYQWAFLDLTEHYVGLLCNKRELYTHHSYHVAIRGPFSSLLRFVSPHYTPGHPSGTIYHS